MHTQRSERGLIPGLFAASVFAATWSYLGASDTLVWIFEVIPLGVLVAYALWRRTWLSSLSYVLLTAFFLVQCLGGRYSVVNVPFPEGLMSALDLVRNPSDRVGHILQGAVSAILIREWLLRVSDLQRGRTLFWVVTLCSLALSAAYELVELVVALGFFEGSPERWLAMQGDPFDAQWDMAMALMGAVTVQWIASHYHDRSLARMSGCRPHERDSS